MSQQHRRKPEWELPEGALSDEEAYLNRRRFLQALGLGGISAAGLALGGRTLFETALAGEPPKPMPKLAATKNAAYAVKERKLSDALGATRYNNFYEFTTDKNKVWKAARNFSLDPYSVEVSGLVHKPGKLSLEQVEALGLEERIYRFRCVEAWSMTVPWIGVPLRKLLEKVEVKSEARYLSFVSFLDPKQAPGQTRASGYTWPYYEALRIDEAMHELTLLTTGVFGRRIPPQNGAPLRLIVPWKYGFKSAKSIVKIVVTKERPPTFWHDAVPDEYTWLSNVEPQVPHKRWSQASEKHITKYGRMGPSFERRDTLPYNGYAEQVAKLYAKKR
jgi:methionine sulfoxide reductase catalytic subunit